MLKKGASATPDTCLERTSGQKVAQTVGCEQADIVDEGRDSPGGKCSTREANQEDLVAVLVVVTYESVGLSNVIRDTYRSKSRAV